MITNKIKCVNCETWLVEHRSQNTLVCHHCGYTKRISNTCDICGAEGQIKACGPGVERIEEEINQLFPEAKLTVLSSDTMKSQKTLVKTLEKIKNNKVDINKINIITFFFIKTPIYYQYWNFEELNITE